MSVPTSLQNQQLFAVLVTLSGGAGRSKRISKIAGLPMSDSPVSWTYNVADLNSNALGTNMTPTKPRVAYDYGSGGGVGLGYYDQNSTFQLFDANEVPIPAPNAVAPVNTVIGP
jgi:hypothetical protein